MPAPAQDEPLVVDLASAERRDLLGTKLARLLDARALGMEVPDGFALTTAALAAWRDAGCPATDDRLPGAVDPAFVTHFARLAERAGAATFVVRTSAVDEDLPGASFAGQYASFLDVRGIAAVRAAVGRCWERLGAPGVDAYRTTRGFHRPAQAAVAVMPQVDADLAGVAFSVDPVRGARDRLVLEIARGTPADVTEGVGRPVAFELDKHDGRVLAHTDGPVTPQADELALILARVVRLERALGIPVDVEWGLVREASGPRFVVFQVRPITALPPAPPAWDMRRSATRYAEPD
jgi:pyruvate,water dikinase